MTGKLLPPAMRVLVLSTRQGNTQASWLGNKLAQLQARAVHRLPAPVTFSRNDMD